MYFKRSITFRLKTNKNTKAEPKILIRATWCGHRVEFPTPHSISPSQWDKEKQKATGKANALGVPTSVINTDLGTLRGYMVEAFNRFEFIDHQPPTPDELTTLYNDLSGGVPLAELASEVFVSLAEGFERFLSAPHNWEIGTRKKYVTLRNHLLDFAPALELDDVTTDTLEQFQHYLSDKVKLRNITIERIINRLRTFLRWAKEKNMYAGQAHEKHRPKLKGTGVQEVITLSVDELQKLADAQFVEGELHLERARDILLFGCYTGLRYSDIQGLTKANISGNTIRVVTIKTADPLTIELNSMTREIIDKYRDFDAVKLLPTVSNQKANEYLKELGREIGLDAPTPITYYDGEGRNVEIKKKWEVMTTHIARRTFISNALAMGIPAPIVMSWSGHKDYKAMTPYIKMLDRERRQAMGKFDELLSKKKAP